ncbi:MAG: hypothetical protein SGPRY_000598 [Prymnesium sp.]
MPTRCSVSGSRTLHHSLPPSHQLPQADSLASCWRPVREQVGASTVTIVITWSSGSKAAAKGFPLLNLLAKKVRSDQAASGVRALFVSKGSTCFSSPQQDWIRSADAYCIEGPNVGARESHTIMQFCLDFYHSPPSAAVFLQDDPHFSLINNIGLTSEFVQQMTQNFLERAAQPSALAPWGDRSARSIPPPSVACVLLLALPHHSLSPRLTSTAMHAAAAAVASVPWFPQPCSCRVISEDFFNERQWGLLNASSLPHQLRWPDGGQFAIPGRAITARSRAFWTYQEMQKQCRTADTFELTCALHVHSVLLDQEYQIDTSLRPANARFHMYSRWANFGPALVDLGPVQSEAGDRRPVIRGMELAHLLERTVRVGRVFDPALPEITPSYPECFSQAAISMSPMRCDARTCPYYDAAKPEATRGGCTSTDRSGKSQPPPDWRFLPSSPKQLPRCLAPGCELFEKAGASVVETERLMRLAWADTN